MSFGVSRRSPPSKEDSAFPGCFVPAFPIGSEIPALSTRTVFSLLVTLALFLLPGRSAGGADIYVPDDFATIQAALDAAAAGDVIIARPGTYIENIDFLGKAVTLRSEAGPEATILDGGQAGSVASFRNGEDAASVIKGFTITNGTGTDIAGRPTGGGIVCGPASSPTITGNIIKNNTCYDGGGIGNFDHSSPTITDNVIEDNTCRYGGAINNDNASAPVISGNVMTGNVAPTYGGAIRCADGSDALIENNIIDNNSAHAGRGGGIYNYKSSPVIRGNRISNNLSEKCGGGIYCKVSDPLIEYNTINGNTCTYDYGGGIQVSTDSDPTITGNIIYGNSAYFGGAGINVSKRSKPVIANNIITRNVTGLAGGGISCLLDAAPTITNNTITGNSAGGGGGISCYNNATPTVVNSIFWNNDAPAGPEILVGMAATPSVLTISYSLVEGGQASVRVDGGCTLVWGAGMIDAAPRFIDSASGDYHIYIDSPCRDAADSLAPGLPAEDFEGDPRIAGASPDMGADEFDTHLYHTGDVVPGGSIGIMVTGTPGKDVTLALGSGIQNPPQSTPYGDLYLTLPLLKSWLLGPVGTNGTLGISATVPVTWNTGEEYPFQALLGKWGNSGAELTNLMVLTVE